MLTVQLLVSAALTLAPYSAQSLDGTQVEGELKSLQGGQVVLESSSGPVTLPLEKLAALHAPTKEAPAAAAATVLVELVDGSTLPAESYLVSEGEAMLRSGGRELALPAKLVRSVRLRALEEPELSKQWNDITQTKAAGDLLVVQKDEALDYLEGVVRDLDDTNCQFELDGEQIDVKREKVVGLVYAQPEKQELGEPLAVVATTTGSRLRTKSLELDGEVLKLETLSGSRLELPLSDITRFDFSSGKIAYLSDLEPEIAEFTPLVGFAQPSDGLLGFYHYRRDIGFEQSPLRLDGKEFRKGLALASRTQLVYKLPDKFRLFRATVGIDDSTRESGSVRLEIKGDGKTLWEGEVSGKQGPQPLELDVAGVRRVEILADYGAGLDVGDRLDLGDAHVTK